MSKRAVVLALAASFIFCVQVSAQNWEANRNQVTLGFGYFTPKSSASNVDFQNSAAFVVDYRYFFAKYWAFGFDYQYARPDVKTRYPHPPYAELTTSLPLHAFTGLVQYRFLNKTSLATSSDSTKQFFPESGAGYIRVTPVANFDWGAMVQAGLDWKIKEYWVLNFDVRYIDNALSMDAWHPYHGGYIRGGDYKLDVNPMTYSLSFGFRW